MPSSPQPARTRGGIALLTVTPHRYTFVGLTPSERSLLESLFTLGAEQGERLMHVRKPEDADLLLVNGDDVKVIQRLRDSNPHALMVLVGQPPGAQQAHVDTLPVIRRPLSLASVMAVLSTLDWPETSGGSVPPVEDFRATFSTSSVPNSVPGPASSGHPAPSSFAPTTASAPLTSSSGSHLSSLAAAKAAFSPVPMPAATPSAPVSARHTWAVSEPASLAPPPPKPLVWRTRADMANPDVLVVSLRPGAQHSALPRGIQRLGFRVQVITNVQQALETIRHQGIPFVFLDQASLGDLLLPLARTVNAERPLPGQPPHLVVVARKDSIFERLRARMAGCAWMSVPIDRQRLQAFFARRGLHPPSYPQP